MLKEFVEKNHFLFAKSAADWREAVRMSCQSLEADGTVDGGYAGEVIKAVEEFGPYIVIMPMVAMPHCQSYEHVHDSAVGFMRLEEPVSFDPDDPEKDARLFFTLAASDGEKHMENMVRLTELLTRDGVTEALLEAEGPDDLLRIREKYFPESGE